MNFTLSLQVAGVGDGVVVGVLVGGVVAVLVGVTANVAVAWMGVMTTVGGTAGCVLVTIAAAVWAAWVLT
jgi:hypothetical protein